MSGGAFSGLVVTTVAPNYAIFALALYIDAFTKTYPFIPAIELDGPSGQIAVAYDNTANPPCKIIWNTFITYERRYTTKEPNDKLRYIQDDSQSIRDSIGASRQAIITSTKFFFDVADYGMQFQGSRHIAAQLWKNPQLAVNSYLDSPRTTTCFSKASNKKPNTVTFERTQAVHVMFTQFCTNLKDPANLKDLKLVPAISLSPKTAGIGGSRALNYNQTYTLGDEQKKLTFSISLDQKSYAFPIFVSNILSKAVALDVECGDIFGKIMDSGSDSVCKSYLSMSKLLLTPIV